MATIDLPTSLSSRVLNALKADPRTVDLRAQAPHFFSLGARMLELFEEEEMADVLSDVSFVLLFCPCQLTTSTQRRYHRFHILRSR